jgi:hypothetical protein
MSLSEISTVAGIISLGLTLLVSLIGAIYLVKSGIAKNTNEAQESAINAMQAEINTLRVRLDDESKNRKRVEKVIDTITTALKVKGIVITIYGDVVNIEIDEEKGSKKSTVIRISDEQKEEK